MKYTFKTFKEMMSYFNENIKKMNEEILSINIKEKSFSDLRYVEYGVNYMKFNQKGKTGYEEYKWIKVFYNTDNITRIEYGLSGIDGWYDEV